MDGNAQSSPEDCRVRMLLTCSSLQSQRICGGYWRWSDDTRALRATATFAQRRHHGRGRLSVGTGSAAKPLKGWDVIGGWLLRALVCGR